jgi:transcriptional regulator with XRE-family HTH domain
VAFGRSVPRDFVLVLYSEHPYTIEANLSTITDADVSTWIGQAIKMRREQLGLTLRGLAQHSGVSSSMISDIERGAKSPTISTLAALAQALGVPLATLVSSTTGSDGRVHVVRAADRPEFVDPTSGARRNSFSTAFAGSKVELLRYVVPPHRVAGPFAPHASGTIEHMHVASGSIRAAFGSDVVKLEAGDSCTCFADVSHHFDNREGDIEAVIYIVVERP